MLDTNTVTPLLQRMEKSVLLQRTKGKTDTRQRIVSLTGKGTALREQAKHIPECLSANILEKMGSVEELTTLVPALDKLIEGLKEEKSGC